MGEINRELLLGYLMNALEDDEISRVERELLRRPKLRAELAGLQQELSPLNFVLDTVEPPPNLARKTCDKIWAFVDREEEFGRSFDRALQSGPILPLNLPSPHFADQDITKEAPVPDRAEVVEELLAASPQISSPVSEPTKRLVRRNEKKNRLNRKDRVGTGRIRRVRRRGRWVDVFAAVGVGILIAVVVFPAINTSKNQVKDWIAKGKIDRITQNVGTYTDLQGAGAQVMAEEPAHQLNFGWQELKPDQMLLVVNNDANAADPQLDIMPGLVPSSAFPPVSGQSETSESLIAESQVNGVLSGPSDTVFGPTYPISLTDPGDISGQTLFSGVGFLPVSGGSMLQTAYGQNVVFRNGKIFVRRLPVNTPSE